MLTDDCMQVSLQQGHIAALQADNLKLKREKTTLQQDFEEYRHTAERRAERRDAVSTTERAARRLSHKDDDSQNDDGDVAPSLGVGKVSGAAPSVGVGAVSGAAPSVGVGAVSGAVPSVGVGAVSGAAPSVGLGAVSGAAPSVGLGEIRDAATLQHGPLQALLLPLPSRAEPDSHATSSQPSSVHSQPYPGSCASPPASPLARRVERWTGSPSRSSMPELTHEQLQLELSKASASDSH